MSVLNFRLAEPRDAEAFSRWVSESQQVDAGDVKAASTKQNPTTLFFAVEDETGEVVAFAPFYCQLALGYLAFNPAKNAAARKQALRTMLDGVMAFAVKMGLREITTLSKENYPVAKWAMDNGFEVDARQTFKFDINKVLATAPAKE